MRGIARVTSRWYGELSFPEFLEDRRQRLLCLKRQLNQLPIPEVPQHPEPHVYLSIAPREWSDIGRSKIVWLASAPVVERPSYPTLLDVAESARIVADNGLFRSVCAALAPTWEELEKFGLTNPEASRPRWDDTDGDLEDIIGAFLVGALARSVASLGPKYGVIFRCAQHYDAMSKMFVLRLLREASLTGFSVAFDGISRHAFDRRFGSVVRGVEMIPTSDRRKDLPLHRKNRAIQFLAVANHGLPVSLLEELFDNATVASLPSYQGPGGVRWAFLPGRAKVRIKAGVPLTTRREFHNEIFRAWSPNGWGYLRRATHALAGKNRSDVLRQHTPYVYGMRTVGRLFVQRQFVELSSIITPSLDEPSFRQSLIGAARFTSMVFRGRKSPLRYFKQALAGAEPILAANLVYEIASLYARRRNPRDLDHALRWCVRGSAILSQIQEPNARLYSDIRLHNVRALIAYYAGNNEEALALEKNAFSLALAAANEDRPVANWAKGVIRANMAKLLEKRFRNVTAAITLLQENLLADDSTVSEHARIELARLNLERGDYPRVVELLSKDYEDRWSSTLNEQRELFGLLMLSIGLTMLGEQNRLDSQLMRLAYLNRVVGRLESD